MDDITIGSTVREKHPYGEPRVGIVHATGDSEDIDRNPVTMFRVSWPDGTHGWFPESTLIVTPPFTCEECSEPCDNAHRCLS